MKQSPKFKNTLILNFVLVTILPLVLVGFITLHILTESLRKEITDKNFLLSKSLCGEVAVFINEPKDVLRQLAVMIERGALNHEELFQASLESVISNYPVFTMIEVLDQNGRIDFVAPYRGDYIGLDLSGETFFKKTKEKHEVYWSSVFISQYTEDPTLTISIPLEKTILVGILNLRILENFIERLKQGSIEIGVVDRNGTYIASSVKKNIYERVNVRMAEGIRQALIGIEGSYRSTNRGEKVLVSVTIVPETLWPVVVFQRINDAFAPIRHVRNIFWIGIGLAIVLALLTALILVKRTLRPLSQLIGNAKRMAEGIYDFPPQGKSYQEVEVLARNFSKMGEAIASREASLRASESKHRTILESMEEGYFEIDLSGNPTFLNTAFRKISGVSRDASAGRNGWEFLGRESAKEVAKIFDRVYETEKPARNLELETLQSNGRSRHLDVSVHLIKDGDGHAVGFRGVVRDITDQKQAEIEKYELELKLQQSQKMESIGTLAGGIAHEFNNVLSIILGNTELAIEDLPKGDPVRESLKEIRTASFRARDVVQQILSFARKTMTALKPLEINTIVKESLKLMRASIPAMIDIQLNTSSKPGLIQGDLTEIHQIVINLCTNASHAMKENGGVLEVGVSEVTLDTTTASRHEDLSAGDFVKLTVRDSGEGIAPDILEKIFEPYFTTKEFGAGSGMGLAVVYGIVKKCKGTINIESRVGEGTTVEVLFPKIEEKAPAKEKKKMELPRGNERILLVDDDPSIANMICQMLERFGYTVNSMTDSTTALERFKSAPDDFDLVITDMSMPKMSGDQLAAELMKIRKDIPILLCTGHSDAIDEKKARQIGIKGFAMKPLNMGKLASAVRAVLDDR